MHVRGWDVVVHACPYIDMLQVSVCMSVEVCWRDWTQECERVRELILLEEILLAVKLLCGVNSVVTLHYYDEKGCFFSFSFGCVNLNTFCGRVVVTFYGGMINISH